MGDDGVQGELRARLGRIEANIDRGDYRPGPWTRLVSDLKRRPASERRAFGADLSRVSCKLHRRRAKRTISVAGAVALEAVVVICGGVLLAAAIHSDSVLAAAAGGMLWMTAFQPLMKIAIGYALGVGYEYAYLYGAEPRFKMRFGDYVAAPRSVRVALHLGGTLGSPVGLWFAAIAVRDELPATGRALVLGAWLLLALNAVLFGIGAAGVTRVGSHRTQDTSGGAAAFEIREALER
jgi:hypothetical protein